MTPVTTAARRDHEFAGQLSAVSGSLCEETLRERSVPTRDNFVSEENVTWFLAVTHSDWLVSIATALCSNAVIAAETYSVQCEASAAILFLHRVVAPVRLYRSITYAPGRLATRGRAAVINGTSGAAENR